MSRPTILLNPGPVTLTDRVRAALTREDQCHREPEFAGLVLDVRRRLEGLYPGADDFAAVLLTGSGTCAVEAVLSSLVPATGRALVVANGVYGERTAAMLAAHGTPHDVLRGDWLAGPELDAVAARLRADPAVTHVVAVHHETTTGRLTDVAGLGAVCRAAGRALLLDAVSSFGAEAIDFRGWNLEAVAATANKCLHGAPGVAVAMVRRDLLAGRTSAARTLYLDLFRYAHDQRAGFSPYTQAVHACFALQEALRELADAGGPPARRARYEHLSVAVRATLRACDVPTLLPEDAYASMLTSFRLPAGVPYDVLHARMRAAGFVIYSGQGPLAGDIFRVATMGDIRDGDLDRLLVALRDAVTAPG